MDHAARVSVGERLADLLEDAEEALAVLGGVLALREERRERLALDQLHREVGLLVRHQSHIVHRHDARMLELRADLRLFDEAAGGVGVALVAIEQDLERDFAAELGVARFPHRADAAAGDLAGDLVATDALGELWPVVSGPQRDRRFIAQDVAQADLGHFAEVGGEDFEDRFEGVA